MRNSSLVILSVLLSPSGAGATQPDANQPDSGRFSMERSGENIVRLDRQTGAMSLCTIVGSALTCRMAADERAAYEDELDRLSRRVTALEEKRPAASTLPSDADVERSLGIMERFMKSFMGMVREFREEEKPNALPQRT